MKNRKDTRNTQNKAIALRQEEIEQLRRIAQDSSANKEAVRIIRMYLKNHTGNNKWANGMN